MNYREMVSDITIKLGEVQSRTYHADFAESDWSITLAETGLNTMTGARIKRMKNYIGNDDTFMLTYGDGVGDIDIDALVKFHNAHGKLLTVTGVKPPGRFGELEISDSGAVTGFNEKPQTSGGFINGGYFVCNKRIF